ncbi:hypothetical protein TYRP_017961 [Tyrophagus putrescentiae]|nr:hypothetical protein TYRP_017961 [Tyrophagus putrescentiae]
MRFFSPSSSGLWSSDISTALPSRERTHRESPTLATFFHFFRFHVACVNWLIALSVTCCRAAGNGWLIFRAFAVFGLFGGFVAIISIFDQLFNWDLCLFAKKGRLVVANILHVIHGGKLSQLGDDMWLFESSVKLEKGLPDHIQVIAIGKGESLLEKCRKVKRTILRHLFPAMPVKDGEKGTVI